MLRQTGCVAGSPASERVRAGAADPAGRLWREDGPQCLSWWIGPDDLEGMGSRVSDLAALHPDAPSVGSVSLCMCGLCSHQIPSKKDSC